MFEVAEAHIPQIEEPEPEHETCGICGGPGVRLGSLGVREHFRCRDCGMEWSRGPVSFSCDFYI